MFSSDCQWLFFFYQLSVLLYSLFYEFNTILTISYHSRNAQQMPISDQGRVFHPMLSWQILLSDFRLHRDQQKFQIFYTMILLKVLQSSFHVLTLTFNVQFIIIYSCLFHDHQSIHRYAFTSPLLYPLQLHPVKILIFCLMQYFPGFHLFLHDCHRRISLTCVSVSLNHTVVFPTPYFSVRRCTDTP